MSSTLRARATYLYCWSRHFAPVIPIIAIIIKRNWNAARHATLAARVPLSASVAKKQVKLRDILSCRPLVLLRRKSRCRCANTCRFQMSAKKKRKKNDHYKETKKQNSKLGYLEITYQNFDLKLGQIELNCPKRSLIYRTLIFVGDGETLAVWTQKAIP